MPRNAVGWLFLASPLFGTVAGFSAEYAYRAYVTDPGSLPAGSLFGWLYLWTWFPALIAIGLVVLLFPDGRVPGRRWRPLLWAYVTFSVLGVGGAAIYPGPIDEEWPGKPQNPLGVDGVEGRPRSCERGRCRGSARDPARDARIGRRAIPPLERR